MDEQLTEEMSAVGEYGKGLSECYKAKGVAQGMEQGFKQGLKQGEERVCILFNRLMEAGRIDDARRVMVDPVYREEQYKAFNIGQGSV